VLHDSMRDELLRIWEDAITAQSGHYPSYVLGDHENLSQAGSIAVLVLHQSACLVGCSANDVVGGY
jgi:hypothetical protein